MAGGHGAEVYVRERVSIHQPQPFVLDQAEGSARPTRRSEERLLERVADADVMPGAVAEDRGDGFWQMMQVEDQITNALGCEAIDDAFDERRAGDRQRRLGPPRRQG